MSILKSDESKESGVQDNSMLSIWLIYIFIIITNRTNFNIDNLQSFNVFKNLKHYFIKFIKCEGKVTFFVYLFK